MGVCWKVTYNDVEEAEVVSNFHAKMHFVETVVFEVEIFQSQVVSTWAAIDLSPGARVEFQKQSVGLSPHNVNMWQFLTSSLKNDQQEFCQSPNKPPISFFFLLPIDELCRSILKQA